MRIKRITSWLIPLVSIGLLTYIFGYSNLLSVKELSFNDPAKRSDIQSIANRPELNLRVGAKLARVNVRGAMRAFESVSWVEKVGVSRNWLTGRISIVVEGRVPVANLVSTNSGSASFIDKSGSIFQDSSIKEKLPIVTIANPEMAHLAARFITSIPTDLIQEMNSLDLAATGDFVMIIGKGPNSLLIRWGNGSDLPTKVRIYKDLIALPENKKITAIDLSNPKYPIVKN